MPEPRTRHVWVKRTFDPTEHPGLVLEWRKAEKGWEALVTYVVESEARAVTTWVPAHDLRPASADRG
jgi:hypothetical protein